VSRLRDPVWHGTISETKQENSKIDLTQCEISWSEKSFRSTRNRIVIAVGASRTEVFAISIGPFFPNVGEQRVVPTRNLLLQPQGILPVSG
jgi:hypothetical protein